MRAIGKKQFVQNILEAVHFFQETINAFNWAHKTANLSPFSHLPFSLDLLVIEVPKLYTCDGALAFALLCYQFLIGKRTFDLVFFIKFEYFNLSKLNMQ